MVAGKLPAQHQRLRVEALTGDTWVYLPDGLVEVKHGQRFRMTDPYTNELRLEATADGDGEVSTDSETGRRVGQAYYFTETTEKEKQCLKSM